MRGDHNAIFTHRCLKLINSRQGAVKLFVHFLHVIRVPRFFLIERASVMLNEPGHRFVDLLLHFRGLFHALGADAYFCGGEPRNGRDCRRH